NRRIDIGGYETSREEDIYGGTALHLKAAVDSVVLDNPGNFHFGNTFTVEFWMKPDSMTSDFHTIIQKGAEWEVNLFFDPYAAILTFGINNTAVFGYYEIPGTLLLNRWCHIAAVFNMASVNPYVTIFLNGQEGTPDQAEAIQHGTSPVVIGSGYLGQIEELRIWQTARTLDQIRADMHLMISPATSGLVTYHQFNDHAGNLIADISGGNNGTLKNMTVPGCFVPSAVPAAGGTSNQQVVASPGNVAFPGTGFSMNLQMVSKQDTVVVSRLDTLPNTGPPGSNTVYPRYWILDSYGGASLTANMTFVVKQPLIPKDSVQPDRNRLYQRGSNADSSWTFVKNATSASVAANTIVFNNVSQTGQFLVPAKLVPDRYAGDALSFNGTSQYVKVDPLYYSSPAAITAEFWMYPTAVGSTESMVIYHGDNGEFLVSFSQSSCVFAVKLSNNTWYNITGPAPVLNQWQHVCGVWDSSTGMKLYINGILCQSLSTPSLLLVDPGSGYLPSLGCYNRLERFYTGKLDEIRIWNVARTTQQIRENMHLTIAGDAPGLIGYWQFNEGSGNFAQDHGGGHMGTLVSMSNSNWITSTIPAGGGTSFTNNVSATGPVNFTGTGLTMNFTQKSGTDQFVVSCIDTSSNVNPLCQASVMNNRYWVLHQFGTGTFSADLMFTVKANLTSSDTITPSGILLYDRYYTSDSSWIFGSHATSVNAGTDQATFKNITSCGQFITGRIRTIYVNLNATGSNSGISWGNAFTSLQPALDSVTSGNRIWVAAGKYKPGSTYDIIQPTSRHQHFRMKEDAMIFGGFAGNEPVTFDLSARDLVTNETILSGDLNDNGKDENDCYHVFYHPSGLGLTNAAVLDGFTIQGSNGDGASPFDKGGGMLNISNSPSVLNCIFNHNYSLNGGGMANLTTSSPTVTNCLFVDNSSTPGGGGMYNADLSNPLMINCTFTNNTALTGGGIENSGNCTPVFNNCIVWGNVASASSHPGNQFFINQGTTTLNYACYANETGDVYLTGGGVLLATNHDITTNPLFINAAGEDCRLFGISPCVNKGNNPYNPELIDIRGEVRIQDTTIDMGAYEWTDGKDPHSSLLTWTGAISNDWNTPGNWSLNIVPGPQDDVYIPLVTNNPLVNNNPGNPAQCRNMTIEGNAFLTVPLGKVIIIIGILTINP
ncbi:MAG: LamG-like jellyroll fold domain-containing protein, partial [Bacteroidota bacterium]